MKLTFLGTGTSTGVPRIGCNCTVCKSDNPKNKRFRSSVFLETGSHNILIDTSTDLRMQALHNNMLKVDAVFFTHSHADHLFGIDDLRNFNFLQKTAIPCYGNDDTIDNIHEIFPYIFNDTQEGGGKPKLDTIKIVSPFELFGVKIVPVDIMHGRIKILGYRLNNIAYLTDCSHIPDKSKKKLKGLELLVLGALRFSSHPTHFSINEALLIIDELKPKRALLTHLQHKIDHSIVNKTLSPGVELAYDGMVITDLC